MASSVQFRAKCLQGLKTHPAVVLVDAEDSEADVVLQQSKLIKSSGSSSRHLYTGLQQVVGCVKVPDSTKSPTIPAPIKSAIIPLNDFRLAALTRSLKLVEANREAASPLFSQNIAQCR